MAVFFQPKVMLISRPEINWEAVGEFLATGMASPVEWQFSPAGDGEHLAEFMGRMCYCSFGARQGRRDTGEYLRNILEQGHGSVLEHANYSFLVTRCSRGFTHQAVRHRAGFAFSQESTHFIRYDEGAAICLPGFVEGSPVADDAAEAAYDALRRYDAMYQDLEAQFAGAQQRKKAVCGTLRGLLPIALESKLGFTANLRSLRHFCEMRGAEANTVEIRMVACQVAAAMKKEAPAVFADFEEHVGGDGFCYLTHYWRKV